MTLSTEDLKNYIVSDRTLREDHLIVAFSNLLTKLGDDLSEWVDIIDLAKASADELVMDMDFTFIQGVNDCLEELESMLDSHAPDGYMFGAHDGDGACFGFWPSDWDGNP